jgi:hypothetical protein
VDNRERRMMTNRNFTNFRAIYDEMTDEVERSSPQFAADHLENWFALLDETPAVCEVVRAIESAAYLDSFRWLEQLVKTLSPSRDVQTSWPKGRDKRLGTQLYVFREIAKRSVKLGLFGQRFLPSIKNEDEGAKGAIEQVFLPMARDLRRRLEDTLADSDEPAVPASDRTVRLDHNSAGYTDAIEALDRLEYTLRSANDFPGDAEEQQQRATEVSAARRLFEAMWVRVEPIVALLRPLVIQFGTALKTTLVGKAVAVVVKALGVLLGYLFG